MGVGLVALRCALIRLFTDALLAASQSMRDDDLHHVERNEVCEVDRSRRADAAGNRIRCHLQRRAGRAVLRR